MTTEWFPNSWHHYPLSQAPHYENVQHVMQITEQLSHRLPLVTVEEIHQLRYWLQKVAAGEALILQGGDCAEIFAADPEQEVDAYLTRLTESASVLQATTGKEVVILLRMAGQYAKPRTHLTETQNNITLPAYRGDIINDIHFSLSLRQANPERMLTAYEQAARKLARIRAWATNAETRTAAFARHALPHTLPSLLQKDVNNRSFPLFTSHECLLLPYEVSLTRWEENEQCYYDSSAHSVWIGNHTVSNSEGAHVEFIRGISNPIGIKVGNQMTPEALVKLLKKLNPTNVAGRIMLIVRMGKGTIKDHLPALLDTVTQHQLKVLWLSDPMHGNTKRLANGLKVRFIEDIQEELHQFTVLCREHHSYPAGIHLEMTASAVAECYLHEKESHYAGADGYESYCDPRLNGEQTVMVVANWGKKWQATA